MMSRWLRVPAWLRAIVLGAFAALALPPVHLLPVLLVSIPGLIALAGDARSWKGAFWRGFCFGMGLYTAGLYWLTNAILVRAADFWWLVPFAAPGVSLLLALLIGVVAAGCRLAPPGWRRVVLFGGLWCLTDLFRQFEFFAFPWNLLGSVWAMPGWFGTVMLQPAAWVSVHGLTLFTVLIAASPAAGRRGMAAGAAFLLVWMAAGAARLALLPPLGPQGPIMVLVQGNIPEEDKQDRGRALNTYRTYVRLSSEGVREAAALRERLGQPNRPILFAWPESAFPGLLDQDTQAREVLMAQVPQAAAGLIGSIRFDAAGRPRNSLVTVLPDASVGPIYDKAHLVPFGEYQPAILPFQVVPGGGMVPGPGLRTLRVGGATPFGPLICYEAIFPGRVVDPNDRPDWLLNITNDAWYGDSAGPRQHLMAARMRAVEEGLPLARAANTGISGAFDAVGRPIARLGWGVAGTLVVPLPGPLPPTLFARLGLALPLLLSICAVLSAFGPRFRENGK